MHRINITKIRAEVAASRVIDKAATKLVQKRFNEEKTVMLHNFDSDPVTLEILQGADGDNITGTLSDAAVPGNLFAFLGFDNGNEEEVIQELRDYIEDSIVIDTTPVRRQSNNIISYRFTAKYPSAREIADQTPVNWGATARGRSWVAIVENGTNSFTYYLYKRWEQGRSEEALQAKTKTGKLIIVNQGQFHPRPYLKKILQEFVETVSTTPFRY